ncbi:MAG: hypothetical protein HYU55_05985 [Nocardioides sp.]|nr:hypothetical protein [Nocardioides sp.]
MVITLTTPETIGLALLVLRSVRLQQGAVDRPAAAVLEDGSTGADELAQCREDGPAAEERPSA